MTVPVNLSLFKRNVWALPWEMSSNLESTKEAPEIIFSCEISEKNHVGLMFHNSTFNLTTTYKHLSKVLDQKLNFD